MRDAKPVILLVEMDEPLGRVIASYLHQDGYQVVHSASLAAARERSAASAGPVPDLWIVDRDSLDAGEQEARLAELQSLPVLLLASDPVPAHWGRLLAGLSVLYKPFAIHDLRQQVEDLLPVDGDTK